MKALLLGSLAVVLAQPAFAGPPPVTNAAAEKFGSSVQLNYTRAYGYRGGNYSGRYGYRYPYYGNRYPYYGYRYPYWGGYYGYPYAAAFAFGLGIPLAYSAGYYGGAYAPGYYAGTYSPGYAVYQPGYYRERRVRSSSRSSGGTFVTSVQGALKTRGYYSGSVDGVFGPHSQQAMMAFQHANNLSETGLLDAQSLNALGVGLKSGKPTTAPAAKRPPAPTRTPTTEGTFVPPPITPPDGPPGIPTETAPAPIEPPPIAPSTPTPPSQ